MALGRYYHPEEFTCCQCRRPLDEGGFFEEKGSVLCPPCYDLRYAPPCAKCKKKITGVSGLSRVLPRSPPVPMPISPALGTAPCLACCPIALPSLPCPHPGSAPLLLVAPRLQLPP